MVKKKRVQKQPKKRLKKHKTNQSSTSKTPRVILVDTFSIDNINVFKKRTEDILEYEWNYYTDLAHQRSFVYSKLHHSLTQSAKSYDFTNWQRLVKYRYSLDPLSTKGSIISPGNRFNIGAIDVNKFPTFEALYLAKDKDTAMQETLGQT